MIQEFLTSINSLVSQDPPPSEGPTPAGPDVTGGNGHEPDNPPTNYNDDSKPDVTGTN